MSAFRKLALLGATLLLAACGQGEGQEGQGQGGMPGAGAGMPPAPVTVARPYVGPVDEWSEFSGRFEATDTVDIRSRVSGYLMKILFEDGAIVKKGDPLFVIDPRQIEAAIRQRQADLALAQSQTAEAVNAYERADALFRTGDISQAVLDQRKAARDSALAAVDAARAALDAARVDLVYTKINAPITGRISRAMITQGNLVTPGEDILTTIVSVDPVYFYFDVDEKAYLAYARATAGEKGANRPGVPAMVALTDETEYTHPGTIDFIDNALSESTGTMRGRAVLENPDMLMTPGLFGRIRIKSGSRDRGVMIPDAAVMTDQSRKFVYVVGPDGKVASRTIEPGPMDKGLRVIDKGLDGSETIIINGLQRAQEGAAVTPQKVTLTIDPETGMYVPPKETAPEGMPAPSGGQ